MPAIENVTRRGAVYWWRRRVRFGADKFPPITVVTMVSLQTKEQVIARRRGASMTERSEVVRMNLYEKIQREGLTAEQTTGLFQAEMIRYRNMLAHQHTVIQSDGEGNVQARLAQMLNIYAAVNGDFAVNGFTDYMSIDYVGSFDQRFSGLDTEARGHLNSMLARAGDLPGNLLVEARSLLESVGIDVSDARAENARRIMCEARAVAAATYNDPTMRDVASVMSMLKALAGNVGPAHAGSVAAMQPGSGAAAPAPAPSPVLTTEQQRHGAMTAVQAVEEYIRIKPKARGSSDGAANIGAGKFVQVSDNRYAIRSCNREEPYEYRFSRTGRKLLRRPIDVDSNRAAMELRGLQALFAKAATPECQEEGLQRSVSFC